MEHICKCNNCGGLFLDTNPQTNAKKFDVDKLSLDELESIDDMRACPVCRTDEFLSDDVSQKLWELLGNVPVNEDDEIEEPFLHFGIGTDREEIWSWFEETFDLSVAKNLMKL